MEAEAKIIILDTDIGGDIDDIWALAMLLGSPELKLRAVTTVTGDTTYRAKLVAKMIQEVGAEPVTLGLGERPEECPASWNHQGDWLLDYDFNGYRGRICDDAPQVIIDAVKQAERRPTVIGIGPATNIGNALQRAPEIAPLADFIYLGGSVFKGYWGAEKRALEYNAAVDEAAYRLAMTAPWHSKLLVPLDVCGNIVLRGEKYAELKASAAPLARAVMDNYRIWRQFLENTNTGDQRPNPEIESSLIADAAAIAMAISPSLAEIKTLPLTIAAHGETIVDEISGTPVDVAVEWKSVDAFYDFVVERLIG